MLLLLFVVSWGFFFYNSVMILYIWLLIFNHFVIYICLWKSSQMGWFLIPRFFPYQSLPHGYSQYGYDNWTIIIRFLLLLNSNIKTNNFCLFTSERGRVHFNICDNAWDWILVYYLLFLYRNSRPFTRNDYLKKKKLRKFVKRKN